MCGKVLKVLFGVATVEDIDQLHLSIDKLHQERNDFQCRAPRSSPGVQFPGSAGDHVPVAQQRNLDYNHQVTRRQRIIP